MDHHHRFLLAVQGIIMFMTLPYFGRWATVEKGTACQGRSTVQFTHGGPRTAVVVVKG